MEVIFLGTGTSHGVPMIGCACSVCRSEDPRNHRGRSSIHVVMDGLHIQVDAAPEFRLQCIRENITQIDLFILTHEHADHLSGMDDLRRFCDFNGGHALDIFTSATAMNRLKEIYSYAIREKPLNTGYAAFRLREIPLVLEIPQGTIQSTFLPHGNTQTLGLVFSEKSSGKRFAYYTDCKTIPQEAIELSKGVDVVVLDGLRPQDHPTHMSIDDAVNMSHLIAAKSTYLIHFSHNVDHASVQAGLPAGVFLSYDGLRLKI